MQTEAHVYALAVSASVLLSFFPFCNVMLSFCRNVLHWRAAEQAIYFALTSPMSWTTADVAYLVPWFNGTCPWPAEFRLADSRGIALINFWAYDHLAMMSWQLPIPAPTRRSFFAG